MEGETKTDFYIIKELNASLASERIHIKRQENQIKKLARLRDELRAKLNTANKRIVELMQEIENLKEEAEMR